MMSITSRTKMYAGISERFKRNILSISCSQSPTDDAADNEVCEEVVAEVGHAKGDPIVTHCNCYKRAQELYFKEMTAHRQARQATSL